MCTAGKVVTQDVDGIACWAGVARTSVGLKR